MPFKHNASRREKFEKAKYRVTNWSEYNEALRERGDVTIWTPPITRRSACGCPVEGFDAPLARHFEFVRWVFSPGLASSGRTLTGKPAQSVHVVDYVSHRDLGRAKGGVCPDPTPGRVAAHFVLAPKLNRSRKDR